MGERCTSKRCDPRVFSTGGADHTGRDFFLRCTVCKMRTEAHVEGHRSSPTIRAILDKEWKRGSIVAGDA